MAANEPRERPYLLQWRSAVLNSSQPSTVKLCLLTLAEWANGDGSNCRPSIPSIAAKASLNEKTVRRSMDQAEAAGFIGRSKHGTAKGWRRYAYELTVPQSTDPAAPRNKVGLGTVPARSKVGLDTVPARSKVGPDTLPIRRQVGPDTLPTRSCVSSGHPRPVVRTLSPNGADTRPTDLAITNPLPRKKHQSAPNNIDTASRFSDFYEVYPRKVSRAAAEKAWERGKLDGIFEVIVRDVLASNAPGGRWHNIEQRFIPHAATYLNGKRWEDEWTSAASAGRLARDRRTEDELAAANEAAFARLGGRA